MAESVDNQFKLRLRVPSWLEHVYKLSVNGEEIKDITVDDYGYIVIDRVWNTGDKVEFEYRMNTIKTYQSDKVTETVGYTAIMRGPLVYVAEAADNDFNIDLFTLSENTKFNYEFKENLVGGDDLYNIKSGVVITADGILKTIAGDENESLTLRLYEYELMMVDSGVLYIADDDGQYEIHQGEYILMRPCERQYGYKNSKCSFHWIHFIYNEEFNKLDGDYMFIPKCGKIKDFNRINELISQLNYSWRKYTDRHYASYLTSVMLLEVVNQNRETAGKVTNNKNRESICLKIENYIKWNCSINTKVSEIAGYLGYSEKYISVVYRDVRNRTIRDCLHIQIIEMAKEALLNSDTGISQIAYSLGFSEMQNFSRLFKKMTGQTPKEYRELNGEN